ncbi:hypothetical protein I3760_09G034100 [Carya illinoinensis]|nr:hypothetical protein I3760_09G034100 [Carya illinoinensis]
MAPATFRICISRRPPSFPHYNAHAEIPISHALSTTQSAWGHFTGNSCAVGSRCCPFYSLVTAPYRVHPPQNSSYKYYRSIYAISYILRDQKTVRSCRGVLYLSSLSGAYIYIFFEYLQLAMAQTSVSRALMLVLVMVVTSTAIMVSAQDSELAPAPAPMDAGAAFSTPVSGVLLGSSLVLCLLSLLKF